MHWTSMRDAWTIWYLCSHQPMRAWALLWASHVLRFASNVLPPSFGKELYDVLAYEDLCLGSDSDGV